MAQAPRPARTRAASAGCGHRRRVVLGFERRVLRVCLAQCSGPECGIPRQVRGAGAPSGMQLAGECVAANTEAIGQGVGQGLWGCHVSA